MRCKMGFIIFYLLLFSCAENEINNSVEEDYIVFGHFYGECIGEYCIEIFKLEDGKLFEDINDNYPSSVMPYDGSYAELSKQQYDLVKDLIEKIPLGLWEVADNVVGCPDCADGGGVYIEIGQNGDVRYWMIDQILGNVPEDLQGLVKTINEKIALLQ